MDFSEAVERNLPLQITLPSRRNPLQLEQRCVAEIFLVDTRAGTGVVWLEPFWHSMRNQRAARICYCSPAEQSSKQAWIDENPRYGPLCIAYQRPFIAERLTSESPLWKDYQSWHTWAHTNVKECGRLQAWTRVASDLAEIQPQCLVPTGLFFAHSHAQAQPAA